MESVVDLISAGKDMLPIKKDEQEPIDLLDRQEIVDRIIKILEVISDNKSSTTFALNGAWGTGKSFVLNMLMKQLWEYYSDKYIVFHYNCWQYDYYEEPLIAIVAAMLDSVEDANHLLPAHLRDKAKVGIELAKPILKRIATAFVSNKIGVDLSGVVSSANNYKEALEEERKKQFASHSFDEFYSFKKAIQQTQDEIRELAKKCTLVVIVDELDRCLPSYAIKVLERLHHLFVGIDNTVVLLAVDREHLDTTVKQIFGNQTETTKYLQKFVNFEICLGVGSIKGNIREKYRDYFDMFDNSIIKSDFDIDEFIAALFTRIDIRTQEQIIEKVKTVHMMLYPHQKKDYSFLCCELIWGVFNEMYGGCSVTPPYRRDHHETASIAAVDDERWKNAPNRLRDYLDSVWSTSALTVELITEGRYHVYLMRGSGIIQKLLLYYISHMQKHNKIRYNISLDEALGENSAWPIVMFDMAGEAYASEDGKVHQYSNDYFRKNLLELMNVVEFLDLIH